VRLCRPPLSRTGGLSKGAGGGASTTPFAPGTLSYETEGIGAMNTLSILLLVAALACFDGLRAGTKGTSVWRKLRRLDATPLTPLESKEITNMEKKILELKAGLDSVRAARAAEDSQLQALEKEFGGEIARIKKEFARMKERAWEEASEIDNKAKTDALKEVLPVTDNFPRAKSLFVPTQSDEEAAILQAYDSAFGKFTAVLEGFGVTRVKSVGESFDYNMMEAIMTAPSTEYAKDTVCTEYQIGYRIGDKCIRPAMVVVSLGPGPK